MRRMAFPIGMYSAATSTLSRAENLPFLDPLSLAFAFAGLAVWLVTATAVLVSLRPSARDLGRD